MFVVFIRFEIVPLTVETHALRILAEILSTPVDFLMFKFEITLRTYVSMVGLTKTDLLNLLVGYFPLFFQCYEG